MIATLSIEVLNTKKYAEYQYAECYLCWVSFMLSVANKSIMLSVIILSVIMLNVVAPFFNFLSNLQNFLRTSYEHFK